MVTTYLPNETWARQAIYGYQSNPTTGVTPTRRFRGDWASTSLPTHTTRPEATGKRARRVTPRRGPDQYSGTYAEDAAFQDIGSFLRAGLRAGGAGALMASSSGVYEYTKSPDLNNLNVDLLTVDHHVEGLGFRDIGVFFNEWNLAIDADDVDGVVKLSGTPSARSQIDLPTVATGAATGGTSTTLVDSTAAWSVNELAGQWINVGVNHAGEMRLIASNTATDVTVTEAFTVTPTTEPYRIEAKFTAGIGTPVVDLIPTYGVKVYLDEDALDIGDTQIVGRMISANITVNHGATDSKRFLEHGMNERGRASLDEMRVTGQLRLEFDRRDEVLAYRAGDTRALRIALPQGPFIETVSAAPVHHSLTLDFPAIEFTGITPDERGNNLTATVAWEALLAVDNMVVDLVTDQATV